MKNAWVNIKPLGVKELKPLGASSDCQDRAVKPVWTNEWIFVTPEGKNPWRVGKINVLKDVRLELNCICEQERPKHIRRPIREDLSTNRTA